MPRTPLPTLPRGPICDRAARLDITHAVWAERAGMTIEALRRQILRPLSWESADRLAAALHAHPSEVWGDEWWAIADRYEALYDEAWQAKNERPRRRRMVDA